jgi:hypothetical protein
VATIDTTTVPALELALATRIGGMTPTHDGDRSPWIHPSDNRQIAPSMTPRRYVFEWGSPRDIRGGATGNADSETGLTMRLVADYRAFRDEDLGEIAESDFWDLHDRLSDQLHPLITGLMWIEPVGHDIVDATAKRIAHVFDVQYMRARRS